MCTHDDPKIGHRSRSNTSGSAYQRAGRVFTNSTGASLLGDCADTTDTCDSPLLALDDAIDLAEGLGDVPPTCKPRGREQHRTWRQVVAHTIAAGHRRLARQAYEDLVVPIAACRETAGRGFPHTDVQPVVDPEFDRRFMWLALDRVRPRFRSAECQRVRVGEVGGRCGLPGPVVDDEHLA